MLNLTESLDKLEQLIADTDDAELADLLGDILHVYDDQRVPAETDDDDTDVSADDDDEREESDD